MIGDLISAGGKLLGGFLDQNVREDDREAQRAQARMNYEWQKEFAQSGIRWKVDDAKAAGIHPLYALGANTTSFSPVSIGSGGSSNWSETLGSMGQDISRAVNSTRTMDERSRAFAETAGQLELEGKSLDNDIKRATLASSVQRIAQQANPPLPGVDPFHPKTKVEDIPALSWGHGEWVRNRDVSNADDWEKRYGEMSDWIMGPYVLWKDYEANTTPSTGSPLRRTVRDWFERRNAWMGRDTFRDRWYGTGRRTWD